MKFHPLFPRFPGSKRRHLALSAIRPLHAYNLVLEPFAGAGSLSHACLQRGLAQRAVVGEADLLVASVWQAWETSYESHQIVYEQLKRCKTRFLSQDPDDGWAEFKSRSTSLTISPWEAAAIELCMRQLTFGGVMRTAKTSDDLNVKWTKDQLRLFARWRYTFPPVKFCTIAPDYQQAIYEAEQVNPPSAIAWVDPPYYLPREMGHMDPAYRGHRPHDRATLEMGIDALQQTARLPFVHTLIYSNYSSPEHDLMAYGALMDCGFDEVRAIDFGVLDTMNQGNGESKVQAHDLILVAHKTRVVTRQLSLI